MRVLVTGGAGYIGSTTAATLLDAGHDVVVLDNLRTGHRNAVPDGAQLVEGDIADPDALRDLLRGGVDACLHFAALAEAGESMQVPEAYFAVNTAGSIRLLEALVEHGVERFVLSSTAAVYGEPEQLPITEDAPKSPTNAYGASKLLVEQALAWLHELRGLRFATLRYFNASGATAERGERHDPETHLIPLILQVPGGRRERISVFGTDYPTDDGTAVRDYVHVADLATAHVAALERLDEQLTIVCNLGNGEGFSVRKVIETAREVTGHPIPASDEPRRPGDPAVLVASSRRARDVLGWKPEHPDLADIVGSAWEWHQRDWSKGGA